MDKEEAMKILKDFHDKSALFSVRTALETLYPELKESEDEKIRRNIIAALKGEGYYDCDLTNECIAWLEKQCYTKKDVDDAYLKGICYTKHELEKQGDQKSVDKEYTFKSIPRLLDMIEPSDRAKAYCQKLIDTLAKEEYNTDAKIVEGVLKGWNGEDVPMAVMDEKQGEQKPSTEVKPKFHEGDWIVDNIGVAHQIEKTVLNVTNNTFGYDIVGGGYFNDDSDVHLWTIQDAKDGDVLVFKNNIGGIIICKSPSDYDTRSYCRLIRDNLINKEESGWDSTLLVPATKEQRDLLFSKMRESGYEFDFEKKELKKLSQRMISAESKEALYNKPTDEEMKELLRTEYEKGRADVITEMKSSWSEEDEVRLQACLDTLQAKSLMGKIDTVMTEWLKSLKDRVILQPKHEWSIEDERVIAIINNALTESNTPPDDYDKVYDWLESLRQRI